MKNHYSKYIGKYSWQIKGEGWVRSLQGVRESQFALGNGYLGSRAVLEELPYDAKPGTYIAGLYDRMGAQVAELVNLPNPFNFKITTDGEKAGVVTMDIIEHRRILNLKHGLLLRQAVFQDTKKRRYDYQSLRFLSMHNKNIAVMQVIFKPLDEDGIVSIQTGMDTSVYNSGTLIEGRKRHFRVRELGQFKNEGYLIVDTYDKLHTVIYRSGLYYHTRGKKIIAKDNIFELDLRKGQSVTFTKIVYIDNFVKQGDLESAKRSSENGFRRAFNAGFNPLLHKHVKAWDNLWDTAEVSIWGDPDTEKNFRFNIYHMLICAPRYNGSTSIGAKALTGEGYRGHIFWDMEIFLFPFYLYVLPEAARNMLLYRYKRLDAARSMAKENGYKGTMFPWESADSGRDETPDRARDLDGKVIKIHTGQMEHHITADIAYAFYHYYNVTQDEKFLKDYGYEVFFETARFWASRVEYNKRLKSYEIKHVIGPDEFHTDVDNNAFTNMMAKWNLITAYKFSQKLKTTDPQIYKKLITELNLTRKEICSWRAIAARICMNVSKQRIIEQFDGYFKKRYIRITDRDEHHLPVVSEKLTPRDYAKTQFVKQADVIMLLYLLSDVFNATTKKRNYEYYVNRTLHKSSLSLPMHALVAIDVGDRSRAYRFFHTALRTDISNINDNTADGIHAACIGGVWQVLINGIVGLKIKKDILSLDPKLPREWRKLIFSLNFRHNRLCCEISNEKIKIKLIPKNKKKLKINIFGRLHDLSGSRTFTFQRKIRSQELQSYY